MAGFCTNCGSALGDGQAFCTKCGTRIGAPAQVQVPAQQAQPPQPPPAQPPAGQASTAPPPAPPPAYSAPPAAAYTAPAPAAAAKTGSPLVKILLILVAVIFFFGAIGVAGVMYVGYRVRQKAREMGLTERALHHEATLTGVNVCNWLSKDDVSQAVGMPVVRAESQPGSTPGCAYSVTGEASDLTAKHLTAMPKGEMDKSQQAMVESFAKSIFQNSARSGDTVSEHPGETPVFVFSVDENAAQFQMNLNKGTLRRLGPGMRDVPNLGDEAFDAAGAMLFVRKGDKLVRIMYQTCPCNFDAILPLAQKIATQM